MRAAVVDRYGPPSVVQVREVPDPAPRRGEVLVRVLAASVNSGDARIRAARFPRGLGLPARLGLGLRKPRSPILGVCFAGVVEAVGEDVTGLCVGDRVAGMSGMRMGTHAELVTVHAGRAVPIPDGVTDPDAVATLFGGTTAMFFLHRKLQDAPLGPGRSVLVNGASGSVGSAAVQLARRAGARVTAVTSGANADLVRRLGADAVVDYTRVPLTAVGERFDVVVDTVGNLGGVMGSRLLASDGILLLAAAGLGDMLRARGRVRTGTAAERPEDIAELLGFVAAGEFDPLTDVIGGLDAITAAYERVDSGRKVGNAVIEPQR